MYRKLYLTACAVTLGAAAIDVAHGEAPGHHAHAAHSVQAEDATALQDVIIVHGARLSSATEQITRPALSPDRAPDAAGLVARLPGAALVDNGGLSGQVQYRGLFGPRVSVRVDGQAFVSGGPNLMDPPLHYAPPPLVDAIVVDRGVSPVRNGPGLGGGVDAKFKSADFTDNADFKTVYDLSATARSADESTAVGGMAGAANDTLRMHVLGSHEEGGDLDYPDGTIASSSFSRNVYGIGLGARTGRQAIGVDLRRHETGDSGNPPFPMDIAYVDTDFARLTYGGEFGDMDVDAHVGLVSVAHLMTNYRLRPPPPSMMMWRRNNTSADTMTADVSLSVKDGQGLWRIGADIENADMNSVISNPNNANFSLVALPDVQANRWGAFAEWTGRLGPVNAEFGTRIDRHDMSAGEATTGAAVPMGPAMLAAGFNARDNSWNATTVDFVARAWSDIADGVAIRATIARKERAPGDIEVMSWLPTEASGGLADGNIYVGNIDIKPESALIAELGLDLATERFYARPTIYVRHIDDYIQGAPFDATPGVIDSTVEMVAAMNGDATPLRWSNVDARIIGADMDWGLGLSDAWRIDGVLSYVRGERRDIDDSLYRIAPPSASLALTRTGDGWSASVETVGFAEQDRISAALSEKPTPGYVLLNVFGDWNVANGVTLSLGVENVLDHTWRDHLSGYNRVSGSDVSLGERLPGAGRNAFIRLCLVG